MKKIYSLLLLGGLLLFGAESAFAANEGFFGTDAAELFYSKDGGSAVQITLNTSDNDRYEDAWDLGTVSTLSITKFYEKIWKKNDGGDITNGQLIYRIGTYNGSSWGWTDYQYKAASWIKNLDGASSGETNQMWGDESLSLALATSTSASGKFCFLYGFQVWKPGNNYYCNNNSKDYRLYYDILPPAVSSFNVVGEGTDIIAGDGSAEHPYIVTNGGSFTLTVSGSKGHTDANSNLYAKFGTDAASTETFTKTISNVNDFATQQITVQAYCHNSTAGLTGNISQKVVYYKAASYDLAITEAGWASMYLDIPVVVPTGAIAYYAEEGAISGSVITLKGIDAGDVIPANKGVVVYADPDDSPYTFTYSSASPVSIASDILIGSTEPVSVEANTTYVLSPASTFDPKACVFAVYTGVEISAFKAYITKPAGAPSNIRFEFEENNATDIKAIEANEGIVKLIENGKLLIIREGVVYDAIGRVVR